MKNTLPLIFFAIFIFSVCSLCHGQSAEARRYFLTPQAAGAAPPPAPPPAPPVVQEVSFAPEFALSGEWASRHVRDGWTRCDRPVGIAQFEFSEQMGYVGAWSVYDFCDPVNRKYRFEETRFYAGISVPVTGGNARDEEFPMMLDLNWSWLHYPDRSGEMDSAEISISLRQDRVYGGDDWALGYGISLIHDYDLEETSIIQALTYSRKLNASGNLDLDIRGELYWGDTAKLQGLTGRECDGNAFHAVVLTAAVNWVFREGWQLTPYLAGSCMADNRARRAAEAAPMNSACTLWGGLRLSTCF